MGQPDRGAEILKRASEQLQDSTRWRLDIERAIYGAFAGDFGETFDAATAAIANPNTSAAGLLTAHVNLSLALAMTARLDGFRDVATRGKDLASGQTTVLPLAVHQIGLAEASALTTAGHLEEAERLCSASMTSDREKNAVGHLWESWLSIAIGFQGRLKEALEHIVNARRRFEIVDPFRLKPQSTGVWVLHMAQTGEVDDSAGPSIGRARMEAGGETRLNVWVERAAAWLDYPFAPEVAASNARRNGSKAVERDHVAWGAWALHDVVRWGRPGLVAEDLRDAVKMTSAAPMLEVMADHDNNLADHDATHLMTVVDRFTAFGAHLLAAEAAAQAAESDLAPRAQQIAVDAIHGHTSRMISDRRFISVRTVDNHLGRVYRHFGVSGREELIERFDPYIDDDLHKG